MRLVVCLLALTGIVAAQEPAARDEVVKKVRAMLSAAKEGERKKLLEELCAAKDLDWPSVKKGLQAGPYLQTPLVTEFGERASSKHLGLTFTGADQKERGFHVYVPKSYKADAPMPLLVYLHHDTWNTSYGDARGSTALARYKEACEKEGFLFLAPSSNRGCEWWSDDGKRLLRFALDQVRARYNVDENRIALMGVQDGASSCWLLAQEMPDTFSCLMPMGGSPIEVAESFRPLYLGTLDRMDVLLGAGGAKNGELNLGEYLDALQPLFDQRMRITMAIYPEASGDVRYLGDVVPLTTRFLFDRKRNPNPDEVDIDSDVPLRSLWLENGGPDPDGPESHALQSTLFRWTPKLPEKPTPKMGLTMEERAEWPVGIQIHQTEDQASRAGVAPGDVLLAVDGVDVKKTADVGPLVQKHGWNEYVRVKVAREIAEDEIADFRKAQERWTRRHQKRLEMEKEGKEIPEDIDDIEDETPAEEEDDSGEAVVEISPGTDSPGAKAGPKSKKTWVVFERSIRLRRREGPLVRGDFGASWDPEHKAEGVKIANTLVHGPAWRAGFRDGDVIVSVGDTRVAKVRDVNAFFETFDWKGFVDFTVRRPSTGGQFEEKSIRMKWEDPVSGRVDVRIDRGDRAFHALVRDVKSFTIRFNEELVAPEKPIHLFVNDIPWNDLVDPASAPDYEQLEGEALRQKRLERARIEGWKPDPVFALREGVERRDRALVYGALRTFDLQPLKAGFEAAKQRAADARAATGRRIAEAVAGAE